MIKFESEKHLENFFVKHFEDTGECLINDIHYHDLTQQLNIGSYGITDLIYSKYENDCNIIYIVELKNTAPKFDDVAQISRYRTYFERAFGIYENVIIRCALVFPEQESYKDVIWLFDQSPYIDFFSFSLDPKNGISFDLSHGWYKKDEDFAAGRSLLTNPVESSDESPF